MKNYVIPSDKARGLYKTPERIAWLSRLLDASNERGELTITRRKASEMFGCSQDTARYFLDEYTEIRNGLLCVKDFNAYTTEMDRPIV